MEWKNRTVRIFGSRYRLRFVDRIKVEGDSFCFGLCDTQRFIISIAVKDIDGKPLNDDIIKTSLIHELVHAVLVEGQYLNLNEDEPLVEWMARCFKHLMDQKVLQA